MTVRWQMHATFCVYDECLCLAITTRIYTNIYIFEEHLRPILFDNINNDQLFKIDWNECTFESENVVLSPAKKENAAPKRSWINSLMSTIIKSVLLLFQSAGLVCFAADTCKINLFFFLTCWYLIIKSICKYYVLEFSWLSS